MKTKYNQKITNYIVTYYAPDTKAYYHMVFDEKTAAVRHYNKIREIGSNAKLYSAKLLKQAN